MPEWLYEFLVVAVPIGLSIATVAALLLITAGKNKDDDWPPF